jgi:DNA-binding protein, YbaB/EbfC family
MMNFNQLVRQAQQMQRKVNKLKNEFDEKEFEFASQQDLITGKINGNLEIIDLKINKDLLDEENKEMLEDLLVVTINENIAKIAKEKEDTINNATNGVDVSAFL